MNRRDFISASTKLSSAVLLANTLPAFSAKSTQQLNVLVLGGRDFFGPTLITKLVKQGHNVTMFNRGFTNTQLFPQLTWIKGDREIKDGSGLINLKNHLRKNKFDWVIDTWQKAPQAVLDMAKLLKPHIGQYHYISSISVYKDKLKKGINESYPLTNLDDSSISDTRLPYAKRKAWAETVLFEELADKVTTFRSHGMRSDRTPNRIYEPYWPARFLEGGEILLPKDEDHVMQVCDVDSMVDFMSNCQQKALTGAFNIARETMAFEQYIKQVEQVTQQPNKKVWLAKDFLAKHGIEPYRHLPLWRPQLPGFYHIDVNKALASGLVNRSIKSMVTDQLAGYLRRNPKQDFMFGGRGTISRQKEKQVLANWHATS